MSTLGELAFKTAHIYAQCSRCSHFGMFRVADLVIKHGHGMALELLERNLQCSNCKTHNARFTTTRPTSNPSMIEKHKVR